MGAALRDLLRAAWWFIPRHKAVLGFPVGEHTEGVALLATTVLYIIGDAIDDVLFDDLTKRRPQGLVNLRDDVKTKLNLEEKE